MEKDNGTEIKEAGTETGRSGSDRNISDTATSTAGTGTAGTGTAGTGTAGTGTTGTGKRKTKEKEPVEVAVVVPEEKPKKKRKVTKAKKEEKAGVKSEDLSALLMGISNAVASKPKLEHWKLTKQEAKQISDPLSNIIEKSEVFSKIAEHSDSIALATACITVFAPKVMTTYMLMQAEREVKRNVTKHRTNKPSNKERKSGSGANSNDRKHNTEPSFDDSFSDSALYSTVDQLV